MSSVPTIGFIGLGIMGGAMSLNLLKAGYGLVVNDLHREAAERQLAGGATWAETPAELATTCDAIFTCLPSLKAIEEVHIGPTGLTHGIRPGAAVFEMSTNALDLLKRLHAAFADRRAHLLDAPISGGAKGARQGKMGIWVGGDRAAYDRFEPVLRAMGDMPTHVGDIGAGLVTKLVHNCASQSMQAALAEAFTLGVKAGAEPLSLWRAIRQGSIGRRRSFDGLSEEFLPASYDAANAALRIVEKDMTIATELGRELRVPMRFANLALADITEAMNRGWETRDARSVMLLPQERAGVVIRVEPERIAEVYRDDPAAPTDTKNGRSA